MESQLQPDNGDCIGKKNLGALLNDQAQKKWRNQFVALSNKGNSCPLGNCFIVARLRVLACLHRCSVLWRNGVSEICFFHMMGFTSVVL